MSRPAAVPEAYAHLTDLSLDATGSFVLHATDEYFAPAERLLRPGAPAWREDAYTDRGKWMDGWESRRRRSPGHDAVIVRLGTPGEIAGVLVDTTHFKGNAPQEVSLEAIEAPPTASAEALLALPVVDEPGAGWLEIVPRTAVRPDHPNALVPARALARATHVRLRIHPDGGVARLRVYGHVRPRPEAFWGEAAVDLASLALGAGIAAASDAFFGPPANLLLPGRGANMGDGWETRRRRSPGSDWCVVRLARRGRVQRIELDTHFFKGNAPVATVLEALDAGGLAPAKLAPRLAAREGWTTLVDGAPLAPHQSHAFVPPLPAVATHLRVHILPHGGVNRLRVFGAALDTPGEAAALAALHALAAPAREALLRSLCGAAAFASGLAARLPAADFRALFAAVRATLASLAEADWLAAFAAHPRLGEAQAPAAATRQSAAWSGVEQSALAGADADARAALAAANAAYAERFGFVFLLHAAGRGPAEVLDALAARLGNDRATELANAAREQASITQARLAAWLLAHGAA